LCRWGFPVYHDEAAANLVGLATISHTKYDFHGTMRLAARAVREAENAGDVQHVIAGERLMGSACKILGRYSEAESHLKCAIERSESCDAHRETARLLLVYAHLLYDLATLQEDVPTRAKRFFEDALAEAECIHDLYSTLEAKIGLGLCALGAGYTQDAENYVAGLEASVQETEHPELHAQLRFLSAAVAHQRGQLASARLLYESIFESSDRSSACKAHIGLGAIDWHSGRREQAEIHWKEALRLARLLSEARQELARHAIRLCQANPHTSPR